MLSLSDAWAAEQGSIRLTQTHSPTAVTHGAGAANHIVEDVRAAKAAFEKDPRFRQIVADYNALQRTAPVEQSVQMSVHASGLPRLLALSHLHETMGAATIYLNLVARGAVDFGDCLRGILSKELLLPEELDFAALREVARFVPQDATNDDVLSNIEDLANVVAEEHLERVKALLEELYAELHQDQEEAAGTDAADAPPMLFAETVRLYTSSTLHLKEELAHKLPKVAVELQSVFVQDYTAPCAEGKPWPLLTAMSASGLVLSRVLEAPTRSSDRAFNIIVHFAGVLDDYAIALRDTLAGNISHQNLEYLASLDGTQELLLALWTTPPPLIDGLLQVLDLALARGAPVHPRRLALTPWEERNEFEAPLPWNTLAAVLYDGNFKLDAFAQNPTQMLGCRCGAFAQHRCSPFLIGATPREIEAVLCREIGRFEQRCYGLQVDLFAMPAHADPAEANGLLGQYEAATRQASRAVATFGQAPIAFTDREALQYNKALV